MFFDGEQKRMTEQNLLAKTEETKVEIFSLILKKKKKWKNLI